jgi:hypothetical protein
LPRARAGTAGSEKLRIGASSGGSFDGRLV